MKIEITKEEFEKAVPSAREPSGDIFAVMEDAIQTELAHIEEQYLGYTGAVAVEAGNGVLLVQTVKRLACVRAFMNEMRSLDLVLTATGFGVVSTNDTTPASKMRVDALDGQLRRQERLLVGTLLDKLFLVHGWNQQAQRRWHVETVFYKIQQLEEFAGINRPEPKDWDAAVLKILAADAFLRRHIGNAYMDELVEKLTRGGLDEWDAPVVRYLQQDIGACIAGNALLREEIYSRMIQQMERSLTHYPTYADGEGYRLNHAKVNNYIYENHAEDGAFHFVG